MKKPKKPTKSAIKKSKVAKAPASQELSEEQLERVAGGAADEYLKIEVQSTTIGSATGGAGAGKIKFW
jgi:hypothetical protein